MPIATLYGVRTITRSSEVLAKLSHIHLVGSVEHAEYVYRLGEQPSRIHIVGDVASEDGIGKANWALLEIAPVLSNIGPWHRERGL